MFRHQSVSGKMGAFLAFETAFGLLLGAINAFLYPERVLEMAESSGLHSATWSNFRYTDLPIHLPKRFSAVITLREN